MSESQGVGGLAGESGWESATERGGGGGGEGGGSYVGREPSCVLEQGRG